MAKYEVFLVSTNDVLVADYVDIRYGCCPAIVAINISISIGLSVQLECEALRWLF